MLILGRRNLEAVLVEYVERYNTQRLIRPSTSVRHLRFVRPTLTSATATFPSCEELIV